MRARPAALVILTRFHMPCPAHNSRGSNRRARPRPRGSNKTRLPWTEHVPTDDEFESPAEYDAHFDHPDGEYKVVGFEDEYAPALTWYDIMSGDRAAEQKCASLFFLAILSNERGGADVVDVDGC